MVIHTTESIKFLIDNLTPNKWYALDRIPALLIGDVMTLWRGSRNMMTDTKRLIIDREKQYFQIIYRHKVSVAERFAKWPTWKEDILALYKQKAKDNDIRYFISEHCYPVSSNLWGRWMKEEKEFAQVIVEGRAIANHHYAYKFIY